MAIHWEKGPERVFVGSGEENAELQLRVDKLQRVSWIAGLAPWSTMATFTFRWEASIWSADRCYVKFMRKRLPGASYCVCLERNPGRNGYHAHALWADCTGVYRKEMWHSWFELYGRALIEPVRNPNQVSDYAAKYLCKADCGFRVFLQGWRIEQMHHRSFALGELVA
jgi:hypothetical protein